MKKRITFYPLLAVLGFCLIFTSCSKEEKDEPAPTVTNSQKLTGNDWVLVSYVTNDPDYDYCENLGNGTYELVGCTYIEECSADDFYDFNMDGTFTYQTGAELCSGEIEGEIFQGKWSFNGTETQLILIEDAFTDIWDVQSLTATQWVRVEIYDSNGVTITETLTYQ